MGFYIPLIEGGKMKLTVKLKQYTPLIHFQHEQDGATLRASELKPKLDKFIKYDIEKFIIITDEQKKTIKKEFLEKEKINNYKIKITSKIKNKIRYKTFISRRESTEYKSKKIKIGAYFGEYYSLELTDIEVEFFSFDEKILELLKIAIEHVTICENFGCNQSKGFGSFIVIEYKFSDQSEFIRSKIDVEEKLRKISSVLYTKDNINPLECILKDYKKLKSGQCKPKYEKSLLMSFFYNNKEKIRWEKAFIKKSLEKEEKEIFKYLKNDHKHENYEEINNSKFIRGIFGLSDRYEFSLDNHPKYTTLVVRIKDAITEDEAIERCHSPLYFKVIQNKVYVIHKKIPDKMYDRKFNFSLYLKYVDKKRKKNIEDLIKENFLSLKTPKKSEFNIIEFLVKNLSSLNYKKVGDNNA